MSEQPDIVLVRDMHSTGYGEMSVGAYSALSGLYLMGDGDEYSREQLEREYKPVFLWSESPDNARWMSLAHILCSDLGSPPGHIEDRLNAAIRLNAANDSA